MPDALAAGDDLLRTLAALARCQATWLADAHETLPPEGAGEGGDPAFAAAFRRWAEELTAVRLHLYRAESRLLHFVLAAAELHREPTCDLVDGRGIHRRWRMRFSGWFTQVHLTSTYRRLDALRDLDAEPVNADLVTDLATIAEVAESTAGVLGRIAEERDLSTVQDLAFYRVLTPWRLAGRTALDQSLRWFDETLAETEDW